MLAGGLTAENVAEAVELSAAPIVDTSSGVEDSFGRKNPEKIAKFLRAVSEIRRR
jgi:phosphoribosylanthranilate isomerase